MTPPTIPRKRPRERKHRDRGLGITHRTGIPRWDGRHMDYFMAVDGLIARRGERIDRL